MLNDNERELMRRLMTSRSRSDLEPLLDLGTRCLDIAVAVWRDISAVGEREPDWNRDSYETPHWLIAKGARRWPDAFFQWVRASHVADVVTYGVAHLDDDRAADYLLDVVRGIEPGAGSFARGEAIRALAAWRRAEAVEPAIAMLAASDSLEVSAAAQALEVLADHRALPSLRAVAADGRAPKGTLASVARTVARLESGEPFPDLQWIWVTVPGGRPAEYLVGARDPHDAAELVESFARSPRTHVHPADLRAGETFTFTEPPPAALWRRPVGLPICRGIHRPWQRRAELF